MVNLDMNRALFTSGPARFPPAAREWWFVEIKRRGRSNQLRFPACGWRNAQDFSTVFALSLFACSCVRNIDGVAALRTFELDHCGDPFGVGTRRGQSYTKAGNRKSEKSASGIEGLEHHVFRKREFQVVAFADQEQANLFGERILVRDLVPLEKDPEQEGEVE